MNPAGSVTPTRLHQTRFGGKDAPPDEQGDCWATAVCCLAGLTSEDRDELHRQILAAWGDGDDPDLWWEVTQTFLL